MTANRLNNDEVTTRTTVPAASKGTSKRVRVPTRYSRVLEFRLTRKHSRLETFKCLRVKRLR